MAEDFYPVMTTEDLFKVPVKHLVEENGHMYLWITNAFILEGMLLMKHWGFVQKTMITWDKGRIGTGWHFRGQTEHMLFGVRGSQPIAPAIRMPTIFYEKPHKHSAKPRKAYEIIERASPPPRIELFARKRRRGWDSWGNDARNPDPALEEDMAREI